MEKFGPKFDRKIPSKLTFPPGNLYFWARILKLYMISWLLNKFLAQKLCWASETSKIQLFTRFFTHFLGPICLRYSQGLYQGHTSPSRASSSTIGLLYLQNPPFYFGQTNFVQNFLPVWPVPIQNTHPGNLGLILSYRNFSHPTCQPPRQPVKLSPEATRKWQHLRFICVFHIFQKIF